MRPDERHRSASQFSFDPEQRVFDFNPIEATPEESESLRQIALQWTLDEAAEDFQPLPGESMREFLEAREGYLRELETFGPLFPRAPCEAWQIVQGLRRAAPVRQPRQLTLPFDQPKP